MNTFDESLFCSTCGEQYAYCGCPNDDSGPFSALLPCADCAYQVHALIYFAGDPAGRCSYCHNNKRASYSTYAEPDWF